MRRSSSVDSFRDTVLPTAAVEPITVVRSSAPPNVESTRLRPMPPVRPTAEIVLLRPVTPPVAASSPVLSPLRPRRRLRSGTSALQYTVPNPESVEDVDRDVEILRASLLAALATRRHIHLRTLRLVGLIPTQTQICWEKAHAEFQRERKRLQRDANLQLWEPHTRVDDVDTDTDTG